VICSFLEFILGDIYFVWITSELHKVYSLLFRPNTRTLPERDGSYE